MGALTLPIAFTAGLLSFLSPCVVPMVPVYLASLTSAPAATAACRRTTFFQALSFVAGFSVIFSALGASLGLVGMMVPAILLRRIAGILLILFGLFLFVAPRVHWLNREVRLHTSITGSGYLRSFLIGMVFSLGWAPCVGPILGGILALASSSQTAWQGACLLMVYSAGMGAPFLIAALALGAVTPLMKWFSRHGNVISILSGVLLLAVGVMMLTGTLAYLYATLQN